MPLLGRHKSSSASVAAANAAAAAAAAATVAASSSINLASQSSQQVCDSPLFGLRKQLDLSSSNSQQQQQQQQQHQTHSHSTPEMSSSEAAAELSSIPQQITRQQIHYAFSIMDTNQDGLIDLRDLSQMLANLGVPIDQAILSHIMSTVSKRGDHRVSEAEFLEWISQFIQINDNPQLAPPTSRSVSPGGLRNPASRRPFSGKGRAIHRSSTASSSLAATPAEVPKARRGSGSGLALMRSLSASHTATPSSAATCAQYYQPEGQAGTGRQVNVSSLPVDSDARNDLKAAFCVFDLDGDGFITLDEVRAGLKLLGEESWTPGELRRLFSKCSASSPSSASSSDLSNQRISIEDFVQLLL